MLSELNKEISLCQKCALAMGCRQKVLGEGFVHGGLMIVGEGPGQREAELGRPFVGRSGKLLDDILTEVGFSRQTNTYITNLVKCRPPGNRTPLAGEYKACLSYLSREIELIKPKIILLLGATAIKGFLGSKAPLGQVRGKWQEANNLVVLPTYHPAAILRNPKLRPILLADLRLVADNYHQLEDTNHQI